MKQILEHSDLYKDFSLWDFSREALILDRVMKGKTEMEIYLAIYKITDINR